MIQSLFHLIINYFITCLGFQLHAGSETEYLNEIHDNEGLGKTQGLYGCIKPTLPKSSVAIFLKDKNGNLEFKAIEKVENVNDPLSVNDKFKVFNTPGGGDSGSPVSAKVIVPDPDTVIKKEKRRVIVAVQSNGQTPTNLEDVVPGEDCYIYGTKVNKNIISWIKKHHSIELYTGEMKIS